MSVLVILSCLLLLKSVIDVFNEPILLERLSNELLRFVILSFEIELSGIVNDDVFYIDAFKVLEQSNPSKHRKVFNTWIWSVLELIFVCPAFV